MVTKNANNNQMIETERRGYLKGYTLIQKVLTKKSDVTLKVVKVFLFFFAKKQFCDPIKTQKKRINHDPLFLQNLST